MLGLSQGVAVWRGTLANFPELPPPIPYKYIYILYTIYTATCCDTCDNLGLTEIKASQYDRAIGSASPGRVAPVALLVVLW